MSHDFAWGQSVGYHTCAKLQFPVLKTATPTYYYVVSAPNCVANCYATPDKLFPGSLRPVQSTAVLVVKLR